MGPWVRAARLEIIRKYTSLDNYLGAAGGGVLCALMAAPANKQQFGNSTAVTAHGCLDQIERRFLG